MSNIHLAQSKIGRFAPSPTGYLHLGSLMTAVASYCMVKQQAGKWLLRIEDVDWQRCKPEYGQQILKDLEKFALYWDDEVRYQSQHLQDYHDILTHQLMDKTYACACSRKWIQQYTKQHQLNPHRYPRLCFSKNIDRNQQIRLIMPDKTLSFDDQLQGIIRENPQQTLGDIVIRRNNGMINYMLAVVVDDMIQGVNQIVRGLDILPLTIPQLVLADYLDHQLPKDFYHLPILVNPQGQKLSKQTFAKPISPYPANQLLQKVLKLLKQPTVDLDSPANMLQQAIFQWDNTPLIGCQQIVIDDDFF